MTAVRDVVGGYRDIAAQIKSARISVLAGQPVELGNMVARLTELLAATEALPQATRRSIVPTIEDIRRAFDQLESLLRAATATPRLSGEPR